MIHGVTSTFDSFKPVVFDEHFNVVLAERTTEATRTDTRNGLGKSLLIDVIHYCLGAGFEPGRSVRVPALAGSTFTIDISLGSTRLRASRHVEERGVKLSGDVGDLASRIDPDLHGDATLSVPAWTRILGEVAFGLEEKQDFAPTFRSLISYLARRSPDGYLSPFHAWRSQLTWQRQVNVAFLVGLDWTVASEWQRIRERKKALDQLHKAASGGMLSAFSGDVGQLEAEKMTLESEIHRLAAALDGFRVHEEYEELQDAANVLTADITTLVNQNVSDRRLLDLYRTNLQEETVPDVDRVIDLYRSARAAFPDLIARRLEEVETFHEQLVANRRQFLQSEVARLRNDVDVRERRVQALDERRGEIMRILSTHGALGSYLQMQERLVGLASRAKEVDQQIQALRGFKADRSNLRVEQEILYQDAEAGMSESYEERQRVVSLVADHMRALYGVVAKLVIEVTESGFKFDIETERSGSQGVERMKIFVFDLAVASVWAERGLGPGFLVHDSTLFDGVDERQKAVALELAAAASKNYGFQYICTLNSDEVPRSDLSEDFPFDEMVRLTLTDRTEDGSLFGVRF